MIVIATSDKGGTGRSVTGSNVVYRRALQGGDVCYVDFDFGSPTAGAIFGISALVRGTTTGKGTHSYLLGRSSTEEIWDVWQHSDRTSLRQRPPGTGRLVLVPGRRRRGRVLVRRRRGGPVHRPLPPAAQRVRGRARGPERRPVVRRGDRDRRHLVAAAAQRDHAMAGVPPLDPAAHPGRERPGLRRAGAAGHRRGARPRPRAGSSTTSASSVPRSWIPTRRTSRGCGRRSSPGSARPTGGCNGWPPS